MQEILKKTLNEGCFSGVPDKTSRTMRSIRSKGNRSTERRLRAFLVRAKVRGWRMHPKGVPGTPEFVFGAERVAIFTDGCFWHGCPRCVKSPRTNSSYWMKKIQLNVERDRKDETALAALGFHVVRLWEHDIRKAPAGCIGRILSVLAERRRKRRF